MQGIPGTGWDADPHTPAAQALAGCEHAGPSGWTCVGTHRQAGARSRNL